MDDDDIQHSDGKPEDAANKNDSASSSKRIDKLIVRGHLIRNGIDSSELEANDETSKTGAPVLDQHLSHYRIIQKIGAGGMGEVYLARDTKLDRTVALKILPGYVTADTEVLRRFVREAKTASAVNHPNVAHIYEIGEQDSIHFIAMEYVEGQTLFQRIVKQPFKISEIVDIAIQVADALVVAHSRGITHRDIKPKNIMITPRGQVKVLDFGLAKISNPEDQQTDGHLNTLSATRPGVVLGTVPYMSPEQTQGEFLDQRTDLFSLGIVLYEMTTGQHPFSGIRISEIMEQIVKKKPAAIAEFNKNAPAELERIIFKCLEKNRESRYPTAQELLTDLHNLRKDLDSGGVVTAETALRRTRIATFQIRPVTLTVAAAVVAVAIFAYFQFWNGKKQAIDSIAVLPFESVSKDPEVEYLSDGITESLINCLSQLPSVRVMSRNSVFHFKGKNTDAQTAGRQLKVNAVLTGRIVQRGQMVAISTELVDVRDNSHLWGEQYNEKVADIFVVQEQISRQISEKLRLKLTGEEEKRLAKRYTENTEAYLLYLKGLYHWNKFSEDGFKRAIEYFDRAIAKDPSYALAFAGLSNAYAAGGVNYWNPGESFAMAKTAALNAIELDDSLAEAHLALGASKLFFDWDWTGCERELKRAIELNPNYATPHELYAYYLEAMGRTGQAIEEQRKAHELDPLSIIINADLAYAFFMDGQLDQAIEQFHNTLEIETNYSIAHAQLGTVYSQKGMHEEAIHELLQSKRIETSAESLGRLGNAYAMAGKTAEARTVLNELFEFSKEKSVQKFGASYVYVGLGEKDQAFQWLEKAYQERSGFLIFVRVDPIFEPLRSDRRFDALLRRMGLS